MSEAPNAIAATEDFEFAALAEAKNYRAALFQEFDEFLHGDVIEIGAGIGQMTDQLVKRPKVRRALAVEPDPGFCSAHRARFPAHEVLQGTVSDIPAHTHCDAVLSINVLEHIREDATELNRYAALLRATGGVLCLFVPARPEIYSPIDKDFGHFRRYTAQELKTKLELAGFRILSLHYFNLVGYFAWWFNFCLLKKRVFERQKVRLFDRIIFPFAHGFECKVTRPPIGQSLIVVARAEPNPQQG